MKLLIGIIMLCISAYMGFYLSDRLKRRRDFLKEMSVALSQLATEIEFSHTALSRIFELFCDRRELCGFFTDCKGRMDSLGIRRAWQAAAEEMGERAMLKCDDIRILASLGSELGMTDISGQKTAIARVIRQLDANAVTADEEYSRLGRTYRQCGLLVGVFFIIILI